MLCSGLHPQPRNLPGVSDDPVFSNLVIAPIANNYLGIEEEHLP